METQRQTHDLRNRRSREEALEVLKLETVPRAVLTFYAYTPFEHLNELRDTLFEKLQDLQVYGRIYLAHEGINAQVSVPETRCSELEDFIQTLPGLQSMPIKRAVQDDPLAFFKLIIKIKRFIVADGLEPGTYDPSQIGQHLSAPEWNALMEDPESVLVDMRNCYESEIGHFEGAICPDAPTFREELAMLPKILEEKQDKKVMLYCTGGIRCEKASAYLRSQGYEQVYQLHGGIIDYVRQAKEENLPIRFKGKNFVFDERLAERITPDVVSHCHICNAAADFQLNCANDECHLLFVACQSCLETLGHHCTQQCAEYNQLTEEEKRSLPEEKRRRRTEGHYISDLPYSPHTKTGA